MRRQVLLAWQKNARKSTESEILDKLLVQNLLAYGTAYRLAKKSGDNGVSLFCWHFLMSLAALVPGLGIYLWLRNRD